MTEIAFRSLQHDLDERFLEADLKTVENSLSTLLAREFGRSDVRAIVDAFAERVRTALANVSPQPLDIEVACLNGHAFLSGFPGGASIWIPGDLVAAYWACLDEDSRRATANGLDMMMLPDYFDGVASLPVSVTAARNLSEKLYDIVPNF